jgi:hypothetical protein
LALRAVPVATTIIRDALVVTVIALLDVTTKCCGSTHLDRIHDATLCGGPRSAMVLAKGFTTAAEDIRHFQPATCHPTGAQKCCGSIGFGAGRAAGSRACLRGRRIKSPASRSATAPAEYTDWGLGFGSSPRRGNAPTDLAHLLLADQIPIWLLTNFSKNVL